MFLSCGSLKSNRRPSALTTLSIGFILKSIQTSSSRSYELASATYLWGDIGKRDCNLKIYGDTSSLCGWLHISAATKSKKQQLTT